MKVSLKFLQWAGDDPDVSRLEQLLSRDDLSPKEKEELAKLLDDTDVVIMR